MKKIIAETLGAVYTQGDLIKLVREYRIRPLKNICAKHEIIETDQLLI